MFNYLPLMQRLLNVAAMCRLLDVDYNGVRQRIFSW
jgi:hypothetical protein